MFELFGAFFLVFAGICIGYFGKKQIDKLLRYVLRELKELEKEKTPEKILDDDKPKESLKVEDEDKKMDS